MGYRNQRRVRSDTQLRVHLPARGDEDGDGVLNADDWCLRTRRNEDGSFDVDADGCSPWQRDSDDDGVMDASDACPGTPRRGRYGAGTLVDEDGCEIWVWHDGAYTDERAIVQETVWAPDDPLLAAKAGPDGESERPESVDGGPPLHETVVRSATAAVSWVMNPSVEDRPLRTGLICAAAAGLIGLLGALVKNHVEKKPLEETVQKRIIRKIIR